MVITLTPEMEQVLNEYARKQGTTVELLALDAIREKFLCRHVIKQKPREPEAMTLADRLAPYSGVISSKKDFF